MSIVTARQISASDFEANSVDIVITASGFETRSRFFAERFPLKGSSIRYAFGFADRRLLAREINDAYFSKSGYTVVDNVSGDDAVTVIAAVSEALKQISAKRDEIRIAIDYSSMTRAWYGALVRFFYHFSDPGKTLRCFFNYSPSDYTPPPIRSANALIGPIPGFCGLSAVDEPLALVIGLGYDRVRGAGLAEYVSPDRTVLFYTSPAFDKRFVQDVMDNNSALIAKVNKRDIIPFPFGDLEITTARLVDVVQDLSRTYRVVVAPLGVKTFALAAMLVVLQYGTADLWRVSGATASKAFDRRPLGISLIYEVVFGAPVDGQ